MYGESLVVSANPYLYTILQLTVYLYVYEASPVADLAVVPGVRFPWQTKLASFHNRNVGYLSE